METPSNGQGNKWLIIFLIYADFTASETLPTGEKLPMIERMKITLNSMLGDIITTPIDNNRSRIIVVFNSIRYPTNTTNEINNKTIFYSIEGGTDGAQNFINEKKTYIVDNKDYYTPNGHGGYVLQKTDQLAAIFEKTDIQDDEEVLLITWDHGSAFGIFREEAPAVDFNSVRMQANLNLWQYPFLNLFWDAVSKNDETLSKNDLSNGSYTYIQVGPKLVKVVNDESNLGILKFHLEHESKYYYDREREEITMFTLGGAANDRFNDHDKSSTVSLTGIVRNTLKARHGATEILKNKELDAALKKWLCKKNKKVGVLVMINCWMMNLHTMFALKDSVQCLVAPQGNIDCPGYNIKDILAYINPPEPKNSDPIKPQQLAKVCVETIDNAYSKAKAMFLDRTDPDVIERFKIFAVDLSRKTGNKSNLMIQIGYLRQLVHLFVKELRKRSSKKNELKYFLKYIRSVCFDFSIHQVMMFDIFNWVQSINEASGQYTGTESRLTGVFTTPIAKFMQSITDRDKTIVLASSSGKKIYDIDNTSTISSVIALPPTGYSLFFPIIDCSDSENLKDNVQSDQLLEDFPDWKIFLGFIDPEISKIFIKD